MDEVAVNVGVYVCMYGNSGQSINYAFEKDLVGWVEMLTIVNLEAYTVDNIM